jgi:hypothetical protein
MARAQSQTKLAWVPTKDQNSALDWLAQGYSLNAVSRLTQIPVVTIWSWVNELAFSTQFREEIDKRAALFQENLSAIEEQQKLQATSTFGKALAGEFHRDSSGNVPLEYLAAVELLRATRWKQIAGEPHRKFGPT